MELAEGSPLTIHFRLPVNRAVMESIMLLEAASFLKRHLLLSFGSLALAVLATNALGQTASTSQQSPAVQVHPTSKAMTPARSAWLKKRCSELVAYYDRYGVGRGENSDGARNHTRIGANIECERGNYRTGIDSMAGLLIRKAFDVPKPGQAPLEPEDIEAPDVANTAWR
jgi:hypothetical protein